MRFLCFSLIVCIALVAIGCAAPISQRAKKQLDKPVNCIEGKEDIAILEEERASTTKKTQAGARSVMPSGIVTGILKGTYGDGTRVATGKYNQDIDAKIQEIKDACEIK